MGTNSAAVGLGVFLAESNARDDSAFVISFGEMLFEEANILDLSKGEGDIVRWEMFMYVLSFDSAGRVDGGEKAWKTDSMAGLVAPSGVRTNGPC
uniref:Putative secreted protein n=1 Tax=Ixodes ricinus TaxID=34613 RepID=A0A6B0UCX7_IXORI